MHHNVCFLHSYNISFGHTKKIVRDETKIFYKYRCILKKLSNANLILEQQYMHINAKSK